MSWRWFKRFRLFGGVNLNLSSRGAGWSWGAGIIRVGVSPNGKKWVSIGIPGTGFRYFKYLKESASNPPPHEEGEPISSDTQELDMKIKQWKNLK